jgi:hypothetical protein
LTVEAAGKADTLVAGKKKLVRQNVATGAAECGVMRLHQPL